MERIHINKILGREKTEKQIKDLLKVFDVSKNNLAIKKGIYIYGDPGSGKTEFITSILTDMNYDIIKYDSGDIRNKSIIENITKYNISDKSIISIFTKQVKKIAIIMDEIDGMNNGDKGGINALIKLIRPKKTKKQKLEDISINPIICIGNYHMDKKIKDLMKVCNVFEIPTITPLQMQVICKTMMPAMRGDILTNSIAYIRNDLRKLNTIYSIFDKTPEMLTDDFFRAILTIKTYGDDSKKITKTILTDPVGIDDHLTIMNETDRTIIGLLWHENVIDILEPLNKKQSIPVYLQLLENMCFSDYIDRITFQKQIWQFNEMSSLMKTFKNNSILHSFIKTKPAVQDIRFTKVLTKYSTEYNNSIFIQSLCQKLTIGKSDLFLFFLKLKNGTITPETMEMLENEEITKLDINRMYKYLDNHLTDICVDSYEVEELEI